MLLVELGSKVLLFMFLLVELLESSLMLGSKVLQRFIFCKVVQISIFSSASLDGILTGLLQPLFSKDTTGMVLLLTAAVVVGAWVIGMATRGGQVRLSSAEVVETEVDM